MTPYEQYVLQELLQNISVGAMYTEASLCVHSERVVCELRAQARCWRRGVSRLFAVTRPLEQDVPDTDLIVLQQYIERVEQGETLTRNDLSHEDPQIWLHLSDYVPKWRSRSQGPVSSGEYEYYALTPTPDSVLVSNPTR
jgi:hypothetical protein